MNGSYILLFELKENKTIQIGKLGNINFEKGFYTYIGSALNGLEQRINRHLRNNKKNHWHIDYLLKHGKIIGIFYNESNIKEECNFVKKFEENWFPIPDFGCSDCNCKSHLFYVSKNEIISVINFLNMTSYY